MSYLNPLRLHFAGRFQANVSTVNNDPAHFDITNFKTSYQDMQGPRMVPPNGWFSPQGDAAWRLLGCQITSAWTSSGVVSNDPVLSCIVADSDGRVPAKLVDLDSEQQLVSEIWGLQVRIADGNGNTLMRGQYEPAAFMDIWDRATGGGVAGDNGAGAMYQSVLTDLQWGDVSGSPFLTALQAAAADGLLSIKFNVDGINLSYTSPDFMTGRIVGSIGPASSTEPKFMVQGRQFMAAAAPNGNFFTPVGKLNFCAAVVNTQTSCLYLDLGNALSTSAPGEGLNDLGDLTVSYYDPIATPGNPAGSAVTLGTIPSSGTGGYASDASWYPSTAGVVVIPLTASQLQLCSVMPLMISGNSGVFVSEWASGAFVRADKYVFRTTPNQNLQIPVYATQFGQPLSGAQITFTFDPSMLQSQQGSGFPYVAPSPPVATPSNAITITNSGATAVTDASGVAMLTLTTQDPGNPRGYIDGQVYGIRPSFADASLNDDTTVNQWCFISFLLWNSYTPASPITWSDIGPIFQQYANLYPVMNRFLNLGNYNDVVANVRLLILAFQIDVSDPNSMPVTRDLSPAKRAAILSWLANPLQGSAPVNFLPPQQSTPILAAEGAAPAAANLSVTGGKTAAMARRLILQKR
jgi:hypothetical protein